MIYWVDDNFPETFHLYRDCPAIEEIYTGVEAVDELPITGRICNICESREK